MSTQKPKEAEEMKKLLTDQYVNKIPKIGDVIKGKIISATKHAIQIDIPGYRTGVVRGKELYSESPDFKGLKPGDEIEATVVELENENGEVELSMRFAGHKKIWDSLKLLRDEGKTISVKIMDANKGGLMVTLDHVSGFLPVSQLIPEHYPRVPGGERGKILEKLRTYVGQSFDVKVITINEEEEKLIVSEKAAWEETQKGIISKFKVGDTIEGKITAVTDFGAFVEFDDKMEGLIHISELAWQRIDHPRDVVKVGDTVKAEIINIDGSKIFLSIKKLVADPWTKISEKYQVGQMVKGKVLKVNPFGLFVELDPEIHGLAHISELSDKPIKDAKEVASPGETLNFKIVSIEPKDHRLGLSLRTEAAPKAAAESSSAPLGGATEDKDKKTVAEPATEEKETKVKEKKEKKAKKEVKDEESAEEKKENKKE